MKVSVLSHTLEIDATHVAEPPDEIRDQVRAYEHGDRRAFDLSVTTPDGLTGDVMAAMTEIPYGETRTYGEIAAAVGGFSRKSAKAALADCLDGDTLAEDVDQHPKAKVYPPESEDVESPRE